MSDEADLDALAWTFFGAFTTGPGCATRLDGLRELFLPQAVIVRGGLEPVVYDVDGFLAPRRALLLGGELQEFREWETAGRTQFVGGLAQRSSGYAKEWVQDGVRQTGRGHKLLQLLRTAAGWRISALAWEDESLGQASQDSVGAQDDVRRAGQKRATERTAPMRCNGFILES